MVPNISVIRKFVGSATPFWAVGCFIPETLRPQHVDFLDTLWQFVSTRVWKYWVVLGSGRGLMGNPRRFPFPIDGC